MIIAIDYDGTIGDTNREKIKWIEENLGKVVSPWNCSRTDCVPIIGLEAYESMGDYVYERESTLVANEVPGALDALRKLSGKAQLHLVTARLERRVPHAREWLERKGVLPCFEGIHTSAGTSKSAICSAIGADILIDDDVRHLREIDVEGLFRILLQDGRDDKPDCGSGVTFCRSWSQVLEHSGSARK
ncbi:MAG: hypothetical protein KAI66_05495 [Lentisphaeria bacterium]|nr:hypothetical protein [Lentisphaeria bacterium]